MHELAVSVSCDPSMSCKKLMGAGPSNSSLLWLSVRASELVLSEWEVMGLMTIIVEVRLLFKIP